jgi:hypothetical protein
VILALEGDSCKEAPSSEVTEQTSEKPVISEDTATDEEVIAKEAPALPVDEPMEEETESAVAPKEAVESAPSLESNDVVIAVDEAPAEPEKETSPEKEPSSEKELSEVAVKPSEGKTEVDSVSPAAPDEANKRDELKESGEKVVAVESTMERMDTVESNDEEKKEEEKGSQDVSVAVADVPVPSTAVVVEAQAGKVVEEDAQDDEDDDDDVLVVDEGQPDTDAPVVAVGKAVMTESDQESKSSPLAAKVQGNSSPTPDVKIVEIHAPESPAASTSASAGSGSNKRPLTAVTASVSTGSVNNNVKRAKPDEPPERLPDVKDMDVLDRMLQTVRKDIRNLDLQVCSQFASLFKSGGLVALVDPDYNIRR